MERDLDMSKEIEASDERARKKTPVKETTSSGYETGSIIEPGPSGQVITSTPKRTAQPNAEDTDSGVWLRKCNASKLCICMNFKKNSVISDNDIAEDPLCICHHPVSDHAYFRKPPGMILTPRAFNACKYTSNRSYVNSLNPEIIDYRGNFH